jgi:hypothetical protein
MDARRVNDTRGLANITLKELIGWYLTEIGATHPFGKNKQRCCRRGSGTTSARANMAHFKIPVRSNRAMRD